MRAKVVRSALGCALLLLATVAVPLYTGGAAYRLEVGELLAEGRYLLAYSFLEIQILGVLAVAVSLLVEARSLRVILLALVFLTALTDLIAGGLSGEPFTYHEALVLSQNVGFGLERSLWMQFGSTITSSLLAAVGLVTLTGFGVSLIPYRAPNSMALLFVGALAGTYWMFEFSSGTRIQLVSTVRVPAMLLYLIDNSLYLGAREPVAFEPIGAPRFRHVVLVVDESVRASAVDLDGPDPVALPWLSTHRDRFVDLGTASSGAICSNDAQHILMSAARADDFPDPDSRTFRSPSLFQYAARAVGQTALIFSQGRRDDPPGYLRAIDAEAVPFFANTLERYPSAAPYETDFYSLPLLDSLCSLDTTTFTYFVKFGAHFNYELDYPPAERAFTPVLEPSLRRVPDRTRTMNSYRNAVRYTVDRWFERLDSTFAGQSVLFIYTSDHGQSIQDDSSTSLTHCIKGPAHPSMAAVPLLLYSPDASLLERVREMVPAENKDAASHFELAATLLTLFGYDPAEVHRRMGATLFDRLDGTPREYFSGDLFARSALHRNVFPATGSPYRAVSVATPLER